MTNVKINPIFGTPALILEGDERTLVIADLHLGIEYELLKKGINVPNQTFIIKNEIESLISDEGADKLIFLGDIKHNIPNISAIESKNIPKFLDLPVPYIIIKGNHDGNIELLSGHKSYPYLLKDGILLAHGHMKIPSVDYDVLIMGHSHPSIELIDELGKKTREKCWIRGRMPTKKEIIIMPAFNPLIIGVPFNKKGAKIPGTVFKKYEPKELIMRAYLLDGTDLGLIKDIK